MRKIAAAATGFVASLAISAGHAKSADHSRADAQALELAKQAIALRSVRGPGNQAPQVAALFKSALVAGGFADADVTITPVDDTAFLIARWKGRDPKLKPLGSWTWSRPSLRTGSAIRLLPSLKTASCTAVAPAT